MAGRAIEKRSYSQKVNAIKAISYNIYELFIIYRYIYATADGSCVYEKGIISQTSRLTILQNLKFHISQTTHLTVSLAESEWSD